MDWASVITAMTSVALRKESVDRNCRHNRKVKQSNKVALRKESVDRNQQGRNGQNIKRRSLSARRAWIEIGSVISENRYRQRSLSARRAWIEILVYLALIRYLVSLSARRAWIEIKKITKNIACSVKSLSARRAWIEMSHPQRED